MSGSERALPQALGRYTLVERVGGGGMATVYRATLHAWAGGSEGAFEKEVAVKVIRPELSSDPQFVQMFLDEARISARLAHANLVQTFDFGQVDGTFFLAMEFVRGKTLAQLLRACRTMRLPLGAARSVHVVGQVARGLGYAHRLKGSDGASLGLVHRDVSPQNVLVSREGEVKLADFGIAKAAERTHVTQPGRVRGKCAYMAPEQARGFDLDPRADVFALGVVLWECLTGRPLFDGPSDGAVLLQVIQREIEPPSVFAPEVAPELDALVARLLSRDPAARPRNGDEVARELAELSLKLVQSVEEIDLAAFLQRLGTGTTVVEVAQEEPEAVELSSSLEIEEVFVDPGAQTRADSGTVDARPPPALVPMPVPMPAPVAEAVSEPAPSAATPARGPRMRWGVAALVLGCALAGAFVGARALEGRAESAQQQPVATPPTEPPAGSVALVVEPVAEGLVVAPPAAAPPAAPAEPPTAVVEAPAAEKPHEQDAPVRDTSPSRPAPKPAQAPATQTSVRPAMHVAKATPAKPAEAAPRSEAQAARAAAPTEPVPPQTKPGEAPTPPGTLVVSTSMSGGVAVLVDGQRRIELQPKRPERIPVPSGLHRLVFQLGGDGMRCGVQAVVESGVQRSLHLDEKGNVILIAGRVQVPLPCGR